MPNVVAPRDPEAGTPRGMRLAEMLAITGQSDETGRLLLEDSAPKKARRKATSLGIAMKTERCGYVDTPSRSGRLMNVSAYEVLRRDLTEVLDGFAWLTRRYLLLDPDARGRVRVLVVAGKLGATIPLLLFNRGADPVPGHDSLPSHVASLFKASRGLFSVSVTMMNERGAAAVTTGADVVRFADEHGHLVRPESRRACAAPTKLIVRTVDVILTGEGGNADRSVLPELVEFDSLWEFYCLEERLSENCNRYKLLLEELTRQARSRGVDPSALFDQIVRFGSTRASVGEVTESLLRHANMVQTRLNQVLGRADCGAPVELRELLSIL